MIRKIHCQKCGTKGFIPQDSRDKADGWKQRVVHLIAKKPSEHFVTIKSAKTTERHDLPTMFCDSCGAPILDGEKCVAITMWRGDTPLIWENEFGTICS